MTSSHDSQSHENLTAEQFYVCRQKGTEAPFTGRYTDCTTPGIYHCVCCGAPLFASDHKFHSGCGWPSFWQAINADCLQENLDLSHGMRRTEVCCKQCDAHLGHVFNDGPPPTGMRYCINSVALDLKAHHDQ